MLEKTIESLYVLRKLYWINGDCDVLFEFSLLRGNNSVWTYDVFVLRETKIKCKIANKYFRLSSEYKKCKLYIGTLIVCFFLEGHQRNIVVSVLYTKKKNGGHIVATTVYLMLLKILAIHFYRLGTKFSLNGENSWDNLSSFHYSYILVVCFWHYNTVLINLYQTFISKNFSELFLIL